MYGNMKTTAFPNAEAEKVHGFAKIKNRPSSKTHLSLLNLPFLEGKS